MAGDHKCPVCSSTFTRPQHVARHMRSHTGDRPYKCNHCGDQFARSDLLSRHVNKCHASEKPPTTTQPARRKGHAHSGSSTTGGVRGPAPPLIPPPGTRKICDPCAHSRTPAQCDSGLPCGKCLQRNTKCTYVKANEAARRPLPGASAASVSVPRQSQHDHFAPPPTVPSMAGPRPGPNDPIFPSQSSFNFTVPIFPQTLDPRSTPSSTSASPSFASAPFDPSQILSTSASVELSLMFDPYVIQVLRNYTSLYHQPQPAFMNQAPALPPHMIGYPPPDDRKSDLDAFLGVNYTNPEFLYNHNAPSDLSQQQQQQHHDNLQTYGFDPANVFPLDEHAQSRLVGSDFAFVPQHQGSFDQGLPESGVQPISNAHGPTQGPPRHQVPALSTNRGDLPHYEGGFSSAFGLMSLDDPAIAAEMSKGASFFAPGALTDSVTKNKDANPNSLTTPGLPSSLMTPGRDANIAELRDFWKAFMRSPSDKTPGSGTILNGNANAGERSPMRRTLSKIASLPDIKTPPAPVAGSVVDGRQYELGGEDLRSYELAVLARQAPSLTLAPRKKAATTTFSGEGQQQGPQLSHYRRQQGQQQQQQHQQTYPQQQQQQQQQNHQQQQQQQPPSHHQSPLLPPSTASSPPRDGDPSPCASVSTSTSTSVSASTSGAAGPASQTRERPSFKRLASQTLGPFESKSVKTSHTLAHRDDSRVDAIAKYESDGAYETALHNSRGQSLNPNNGTRRHKAMGPGKYQHGRSPSGEYPPMMEQGRHRPEHRRLSAPTASVTRPAFAPE